jgi:pyrroline-5-carboxylate reductase
MKIGFIGAGEMGSAIIRGLLKSGWKKEDIVASVHTQASAQRLTNTLGIKVCTDNKQIAAEADRLFVAVKPAQMPSVLQEIAATGISPKPLVSMALGWRVEKIQSFLPDWPVIRIMPNTPLALGEGVTLLHFAVQTPLAVREEMKNLFEKMGKTFEIPLQVFDAATALSGSGPAFVYAFIDALAQAGVRQGIDERQAVPLAVQTVIGAAKMVEREGVPPAVLAQKVATPGGCTAAGMDELKKSDFTEVIAHIIAATTRKAEQVGK